MTNWWSITKRTSGGRVRFQVTDLRGVLPMRTFDTKAEATAYAKRIRANGMEGTR